MYATDYRNSGVSTGEASYNYLVERRPSEETGIGTTALKIMPGIDLAAKAMQNTENLT
jgi:hypothetical protein